MQNKYLVNDSLMTDDEYTHIHIHTNKYILGIYILIYIFTDICISILGK